MQYEIHDKEPKFEPFRVTLTFETRDELERFESFANTSEVVPNALWREIRNALGWLPSSPYAKYDCTINLLHD